ncbi:MAG: LysO family transporter [Anaerovoracaceae bacterium]
MGLLVLYLGMVLLGYIVGAKFIDREKDYSWINKVTTGCLVLLIFTMGARIGSNEQVISSLSTIGIKAAIMTVICFAGSIIGCIVARKLVKIDRKGVKSDD